MVNIARAVSIRFQMIFELVIPPINSDSIVIIFSILILVLFFVINFRELSP